MISFAMRHRYDTRGIVLARAPLGETNTLVTILTAELGLVRARAQGLRKEGAKLAPALATFTESDLVLLRGKDGWRVAGAVLGENWFAALPHKDARARAARVCGLLLRLVAGESPDAELFPIVRNFFEALARTPGEDHEQLEILAALYVLRSLGLDADEGRSAEEIFSPELRRSVGENRSQFIARINRGIAASGL